MRFDAKFRTKTHRLRLQTKPETQRAQRARAEITEAANATAGAYTRHAQTELLRATAILGTPTQQNILDANRRLELRVSEKETALAELQRAYEQKDRAIAGLQEQLTTKERAIATLTREREALGAEKDQLQNTRATLSDEISDMKSKLIAKEQEERRRAEDTKALKKQLMVYLGIAGILCGLGAAAAFRFYPPIVVPLGVASAGFLAAAYLVTQISKWELLGILAIAGAAILVAAYIRHHRVSKIADNAIGAAQELKNDALEGKPEAIRAYAELRNRLIGWFGKTGHPLESEIQSRLKSLNLVDETAPPSIVPKIAEQQQKDAQLSALTPETIVEVLRKYVQTAAAGGEPKK